MRLLTAVLLGVALLAPSASAAPRVVIFNLSASPLVAPERVHFQANSGPSLLGIRWSGWGTPSAVGTGTWTLDCSSGGGGCGPGDPSLAYPARYLVGGLAPCPRFGADAQTYRSGVVEVDRQGRTDRIPLPSPYDFCAKLPSEAAARTVVARYIVRRMGGHRPKVVCHADSTTDLECTARWTKRGRTKQHRFFVLGRMSGPPAVRPVG